MKKFNLEKFIDVTPTAAEAHALVRLGDTKDFDLLMNLMARWHLHRAHDLIDGPREGQDADLLQHQGGYACLKQMAKYVEEATAPEAPRKK